MGEEWLPNHKLCEWAWWRVVYGVGIQEEEEQCLVETTFGTSGHVGGRWEMPIWTCRPDQAAAYSRADFGPHACALASLFCAHLSSTSWFISSLIQILLLARLLVLLYRAFSLDLGNTLVLSH